MPLPSLSLPLPPSPSLSLPLPPSPSLSLPLPPSFQSLMMCLACTAYPLSSWRLPYSYCKSSLILYILPRTAHSSNMVNTLFNIFRIDIYSRGTCSGHTVKVYYFKPYKPSEFWNVRCLKTECRNSKEYEFWKSEILEEERVSLDEICRRGHLPRLNLNSTVGSAKLTVTLLTNLRSLENLKNLLLWHNGPQNVFDYCTQTLRRKLKLNDF